jgi:hypothetical protein
VRGPRRVGAGGVNYKKLPHLGLDNFFKDLSVLKRGVTN